MKMPKDAGWLIPGLHIKRWFLLTLFGTVLMTLGVLILFDIRPIYYTMQFIHDVAANVSTELIAFSLVCFGAAIFFKSWQKTNLSMLNGTDDQTVLESLYRTYKLNRGPNIVAIGGGTGLSTLLKGIKRITNNITAIVTVGDDGGSSGRLREEMGILPPGDIRNCIAALAKDEDLVTNLFQYRFKTGEGLEGHSFGNLFLTALCAITGDFLSAIKETSNVLSIRGRVLPSTLDDMKLVAEMEDGSIVRGESNIPEAGVKIKRIYTDPAECAPLKDVIKALKEADLIIIGPGSLYTSVIPNLLIKEIVKTIAASRAKKLYVANIMTQPGETDNYALSDHINAILSHAGNKNIMETVLINNYLPENLAQKYEEQDQYPVKMDVENLQGLKVFSRKLIEESKDGLVRHSSNKLARAIDLWYRRGKKER